MKNYDESLIRDKDNLNTFYLTERYPLEMNEGMTFARVHSFVKKLTVQLGTGSTGSKAVLPNAVASNNGLAAEEKETVTTGADDKGSLEPSTSCSVERADLIPPEARARRHSQNATKGDEETTGILSSSKDGANEGKEVSQVQVIIAETGGEGNRLDDNRPENDYTVEAEQNSSYRESSPHESIEEPTTRSVNEDELRNAMELESMLTSVISWISSIVSFLCDCCEYILDVLLHFLISFIFVGYSLTLYF